MADLPTPYDLALFTHFVGLIVLFGGLFFAARSPDRARGMVPAGALLLLASGVALVWLGSWPLATPWIATSTLALLVAVLLAMFALRQPPNLVARAVANGLALATVWMMAVRPGWAGAVLVVVVGAFGGAVWALVAGARRAAPGAARPQPPTV